jgi:hypothetical protein
VSVAEDGFSMTSNSPFSRPTFIVPLARDDLLAPGQVFPPSEMLLRVLSHCWRDCCTPASASRAPAPVIELTDGAPASEGMPVRRRAWWLLREGIVEEPDGAGSERLRPFFESASPFGRLRPLYEFRLRGEPWQLELSFHHELWSGRGERTSFELLADGHLKVLNNESWWGRPPPPAA